MSIILVHVIYLIKCTLRKNQYIGKAITSFNTRLSKYRKNVGKPDAILACRRVQE